MSHSKCNRPYSSSLKRCVGSAGLYYLIWKMSPIIGIRGKYRHYV